MAELYDKDGNAVEALTQEEVDAKLDEARVEATRVAQEAAGGLQTQLDEKETALTKALADLEEEKKKDKNFGNQRKVVEDKLKEIDTLKGDVEKIKKEYEIKFAEVATSGRKKMIDNMIVELAGNDKNTKDKIQFFLDTFKAIDETGKKPEDIEKEIQERVKNAYIIATGGKPANPLGPSAISSAGGMTPIINASGDKLNSEQQDLAHKLGIDDATMKKHKLI